MGKHSLLELKARRSGLQAETAWCEANADLIEDVRQEDTYFRANQGRLKLRVVAERGGGTLIYYERENRVDPKTSHVTLLTVANPEPLMSILGEVLGVLAEVRKRRRIFRWGEVQIHLDKVDGLGEFVEFERLLDDQEAEAQAQVEFVELRTALNISEEDLVAESYSDILLGQDPDAHRA
ncbi:MAG: class IV adenylate cyclase [Thermoplasmata archaeon]